MKDFFKNFITLALVGGVCNVTSGMESIDEYFEKRTENNQQQQKIQQNPMQMIC